MSTIDIGPIGVPADDDHRPVLGQAQLAPDLIIAQLSEPTVDGFALCRKLRAEADTRHTPVLVLTRFDDPYTREQIVRAGATAILIEPMRRALLLRQVRRLLARTRAHAPLSVVASREAEVRRQ
jgi:two-component system cell cycle response regulator